MAVTRRGYIFGAFLSGILSVLLIIVSVSSDSWVRSLNIPSLRPMTTFIVVVSIATTEVQNADSNVQYGMFSGELVLRNFATPTFSTLYMTCIPSENACAVSCKTNREAREEEVRALAQGHSPNPTCGSVTTVEILNPPNEPRIIAFAFYVCLLLVLFLQLLFALLGAGLAIINSTKNPTEPIFGLPGCLWCNVIASVFGVTSLLMFGIYWITSGLKDHLAFSYIALGWYESSPGIGYSYWILIAAVLCSLGNVGLIELRRYLLERDPPPPVIKVEANSDGTIFLY